jgi:hypothetical protein
MPHFTAAAWVVVALLVAYLSHDHGALRSS